MIARETTADRINAVLNHESVRPWVANDGDGVLDLSEAVENKNNVILFGEHGGCCFIKIAPGVYEVHTQVLPAGRGKWTRSLTEACFHFMYTRTDAYEIVTRVPLPHLGAHICAKAQGMRQEFVRKKECLFRNELCDVIIYSQRLQDWAPTAPGLAERGAWFHHRMHQEAERLGITEPMHEDDENHNQYVGACVDMMFGNQHTKAIAYYNRWVSLSRQSRNGKLQHVKLISKDPVIIEFDIGKMLFKENDVEVLMP